MSLGPHRAAAGDYLALYKPGITVSAMVTAAWGVFESGQSVGLLTGIRAVAGVGLMVAAAGALNMVFEADTDRQMPRTCARPVACGHMSRLEAFVAAAAAGLAGTALLAGTGTWAAPLVSLLSVFVYACVYTPLKRLSPAALAIGALPGAAPPMIAAIAVAGEVNGPALSLFCLLFLWQIPHFGGITIRRRAEYRQAGLRLAPPEERIPLAVGGIRAASILLMLTPIPLAVACSWSLPVTLGMMGAAIPQVYTAFAPLQDATAWGKRVFFGSLPYLPIVAVVMIVGSLLAGGAR
jgi:protoheme IX farnesyltransferase